MNYDLIQQFENISTMKFGIYVLFLVIVGFLTLQLFNRRSFIKGKSISYTLDKLNKDKSHDEYVINSIKFLNNISKIVQKTPFSIYGTREEYLQYNLTRANVRIPGGQRVMSAVEFNAMRIMIMTVLIIISSLVTLFFNTIIGFCMLILVTACGNVMPMQILRSTVQAKDKEINIHFPDCYFMLHYILLTGAKAPISKVLQTYSKATDSEDLKKFIEVWVGYIDTYGEQEATKYMAREFREINSVCKLMRIIKQLFNGDEVTNELIGFKQELIIQKKLYIKKRMDKTVSRARGSFKLIMIILGQAILSAMSIYLPDMSGMTSFLG